VRVRAAVKRVVFLIGIVITFLGVMILNDPAAVGPYNCGTALAPKRFILGNNARLCASQIRWRRSVGAGVFAVGTVALILPGGYRCLLSDD
jgi:hypothetical protein